MLSFTQALILGILQGASELFPISSLGHSIVLPALLGWPIDRNTSYFVTFLVVTHFATAAVLFFVYRKDWFRIIRGMLRSILRTSFDDDPDAKLGWLLIIGTLPAGAFGLLFQRQLEKLFSSPKYVASFLALNGLLLYAGEHLRRRAKRAADTQDVNQRLAAEVSWGQSARVGALQTLALLPGFSRTGSTLAGGLIVGLAHEDALKFSFLLATPIIGAAAALKLPALFASADATGIVTALLGAVGAAIASYLSVKFLTRYFRTKTLMPFAVYCVFVGVLSLIFLRH
jgi:undecaprenyl-diphosphatase